ncbi:hypothetical protein ACOI1C_00580 [Bacillus sp. DJP31]|uniref:hypothetical protein n=1 Tax=Bacillus sp. DJP31 TaxID=3409789 RepID=UPI003BB7A6EF
MNNQFNKPKGFGEILDQTFRLSKNHFTHFFMILLIIMGPIFLLQAVVDLFAGASFFRTVGTGTEWYEQILSRFEEPSADYSTGIGTLIGIISIGLISLIVYPIADAAILLAIDQIRKQEEYSVGSVLKKAFSRFWPILGSNILYGLIIIGIVIVPIILVALVGVFGTAANPVVGILIAILLGLGFLVVLVYLLTRWSFYFASVVLENNAPGISRSWKLTRNRTWVIVGLYIVFSMITGGIGYAIQLTFGAILGNSVVMNIIVNMTTLLTTMIFTVGYAIMFFDLKTRHDADDLKEMIEEYNEVK